MPSSTIAPSTDMMKPAALSFLIPAQGSTGIGCHERSRDADQHGDDDPARVFAWHEEFCYGPDDQSDQ